MKVINIVPLLIISLLIGGCGTQLPAKTYYVAKREAAKSRPAYKQFQALCASEDRSKIFNTANVEGYIFLKTSGLKCFDAWDNLIKYNYKHYECSEDKILDRNIKEFNKIQRIEFSEKDNPKCISWRSILNNLDENEIARHEKQFSNKCIIKVNPVKQKSNYAKLLENGYVNIEGAHILEYPNDRKKKDLISFTGVYTYNIETNKVLSIDRDYKYWPEGIYNKAVGQYECEVNKSINEQEVLIPKNKY